MHCTQCGKEINGKHYEMDEEPPKHVFCTKSHALDFILGEFGIKEVK